MQRALLCILLLLSMRGYAATEQWITSLSGKVQQPSNVARPIASGAQLNLQDQWYNYMIANPSGSGSGAWDNIFTVDKAETIVKLRYDDSDRQKMDNTYSGVSWTIYLKYTITCYDETGATNVYGTAGSPELLTINYDPQLGLYTDQALHVYANSHKARLTVYNVWYREWDNMGDSVHGQGSVPSYLNDVWLDVEENVSRCYYMDPDQPTIYQHPVADNQMMLSWPYIQGAESYDVEFLFVDIPTGTISSSSTEFDFSNATRVNTPNKHFTVSLAYPRGKIVYRVRGVGRDPISTQTRVEGPWSYDPAVGTAVSSVPANSGMTCYSYDYNGLEVGVNWQYSATYVEDGKRSEAISFYDGSLHNRQSVMISNTDSNAIVSETKYDFQGRPAVQVLPAVEQSQGLQYYQYYDGVGYYSLTNIDSAGTLVNYVSRHFDDDVSTNNSDPMSTETGASNYYSSSSTSNGNNADYVPDAGGYPYAQTRYMNDGTGRVRSQGGVGPDHQLETTAGHQTQYFYGTPGGQVELDRLFGNDVGYVSHYKKNMVQDPNGQVSIIYLDQEGRIVATCLAGEAPENLIALEEAADPYEQTVNLLGTNHLDQQQDMVSVNTLTVSTPGDYEFDYNLTGDTACSDCLAGTPYTDADGCATCKYDLTIMITNTDGDSLDINGASAGYAYRLTNISAQSLSFTVNFSDIGVYTISKTLKLNATTQDALLQNFIDNQSCVEVPEIDPVPCGPECEGEPPTCPECEEAYTTGSNGGGPYYVTVNGDTLTDSERDDSIAYCNQVICGPDFPETIITDPCEIKRNNMLADLSPGGQYFDNRPAMYEANLVDPAGPTAPNANYQSYYTLAVYTSGEENDWLNANVLNDENPANTGTFNSWFGSSSIDNWKDVRDNWNPAWAETILFDEHPEYCAYNYFCLGFECTPDGTPPVDHDRDDLWAHDRAMLLLHTNDMTNTLFNPMCLSQNTTVTGTCNDYAVDRSAYMPVSGCNDDPYFDCEHEICDDPTSHADDLVTTMLKNYVPVYDEGGVFKGYYSIWYLLADPDGIATCTTATTYLSQSTIDIFLQVHDGINNGVYTKFDYFRGAYMYAKELAIAMGYDEYVADNSCPNNSSSPQTYEDGYLVTNAGIGNATPQGYVAHFPRNPMFAGLDGCETITGSLDLSDLLFTNMGDYQDDNCAATCAAFSYDWMETLGACIDPLDTAHVRDLLIEICTCSCDNDDPMGTDQCSDGVTDSEGTYYSFADVIAEYGTSCETPVHPEPDPVDATCSCQNLQDFIVGTGMDPDVVLTQGLLTAEFNALFTPTGTYTWTDISGWLTECEEAEPDLADLSTLPEPILCAETEEEESTFAELALQDCQDESATTQANQQSILFDYLVNIAAENYMQYYNTTCMSNLNSRETFTVTFETKEYYYTLYYYDQAGNLIKTIPPAGVDPIASTSLLDAVQDHRNDPDTYPMATYPTHSLAANYKYNSLQQLIESTTPDGGLSTFWYDEHGRIVLSQNARQAAISSPAPAYSYTLYDALGRPYEAGEMYSSTPMDYATSRDAAGRASWLSSAFSLNGKKQVVHTYYDEQIPGSGTNDYVVGGQQNLRNRVASVTYEEEDDGFDIGFDNATHYSYDIHGNIVTVVQENRNFNLQNIAQSKKRIDYEYDVASGKVNAVHYQQNTADVLPFMDEFHHRYEYDANNRIVAVYTSRDGYVWERDANYLYYDHGPMARTEIGDKHVMGTDYVYTIHGWVKGVNSDTRKETRDIGKDGGTSNVHLNYSFARDAAGYSLRYYDGDYTAIGASTGSTYFLASHSGSDYSTNLNSLYNGNIAQMTTALTDNTQAQMDVQGRNFRYDQLNRIRQVNAYKETNLVTNNQWTSSDVDNGDYAEQFTYDLNGNILTAIRNGHLAGTSQEMDDMIYYYDAGTNRLDYVDDNATSIDGDYGNDINAGQTTNNYQYDAAGNLISDASEQIGSIEWTVTGKVKKITRSGSSTKPDLEFVYDAMGNRIIKIVKPRAGGVPNNQDEWTYTYYVRDAAGNVLTVYERTFSPDGSDYFDNFSVKEWTMYGSSRLGVRKPNVGESNYQLGFAASFSGVNFHSVTYDSPGMSINCTDGCELTRTLGKKEFEFSNHLGNVLETVTDIHLPSGTASSHTVDYYMSDVVGYSDYYVFGSAQSNRAGGDYRYDFNGKETDDESGVQDYGMRNYNASLGRFLTVDPLAMKYPELTPYQFASNRTIDGVDLDGMEWEYFENLFTDPEDLELTNLSDGWGNVHAQTYYLHTSPPNAVYRFAELKSTFLSDPTKLLTTGKADFSVEHQQTAGKLSEGDIVRIDIFGPINNSFVKVTDVSESPNFFSVTFNTLEGHVETGSITFEGRFNPTTGQIDFSISNVTRINNAMYYAGAEGLTREEQKNSWIEVLRNVHNMVGGEGRMGYLIKESEYDEDSPHGIGKPVGPWKRASWEVSPPK